jgi:hypothetical protein
VDLTILELKIFLVVSIAMGLVECFSGLIMMALFHQPTR